MEIKVITTDQFTKKQLDSFVRNFNLVFDKEFDENYFLRKYTNNIYKKSFHCFYSDSNDEVWGSVNIIPFNYDYFGKIVVIGLVVDVFIHPGKRNDPLALLKMYKTIKPILKLNSISAIVAVPNALIHKYWKQVVKWHDIGILETWIIAQKIANVLPIKTLSALINVISLVGYRILYLSCKVISMFANQSAKQRNIRLVKDDNFENFRYSTDHFIINGNISYRYSVFNEENYKVAYLLDFFSKKNKKDFKSLVFALGKLMKLDVDALIFIGSLNIFQVVFIKIPVKKLPRKLYFMGDIIDERIIDERFYEFTNWDFGLLNFDVR